MNKQLKRKMAFLMAALMFLNIGVGAYADTMKSDVENEIVSPIQNDIEIVELETEDIPLQIEEVQDPEEGLGAPKDEPDKELEEPEEIEVPIEELEELQEEETEVIVGEPEEELVAIATPGNYTSDSDTIVVKTQLTGSSINDHTIPSYI